MLPDASTLATAFGVTLALVAVGRRCTRVDTPVVSHCNAQIAKLLPSLSTLRHGYRPPLLFPNGLLQSGLAETLPPPPEATPYVRETIELPALRTAPASKRRCCPDIVPHGVVSIDWLNQADSAAPICLLVPGLTGSSNSQYIRRAAVELHGAGFRVGAYSPRGRGGNPLVTPFFYSAGYTEDLRRVIRRTREAYPDARLAAAGYSLGASYLGKYLAEEGEASELCGAVLFACPTDLVTSVFEGLGDSAGSRVRVQCGWRIRAACQLCPCSCLPTLPLQHSLIGYAHPSHTADGSPLTRRASSIATRVARSWSTVSCSCRACRGFSATSCRRSSRISQPALIWKRRRQPPRVCGPPATTHGELRGELQPPFCDHLYSDTLLLVALSPWPLPDPCARLLDLTLSWTVAGFDGAAIAPMMGCESAVQYYREASCGALLHRVRTPMLVVSARNDPIASADNVDRQPFAAEPAAPLALCVTDEGGHSMGWPEGWRGTGRAWSVEVLREFVELVSTSAGGGATGAPEEQAAAVAKKPPTATRRRRSRSRG